MPNEIRTFFEAYRAAFDSLDGEAVASLYAEPAAIAQDGKFTYWPSRSEVADNMVKLCHLYRERGYVCAAFEEGTYLQQGEDYAVVDLRWRIEWKGSNEPWQFSTTYNLVRTAGGWRILLCTAYSEASLFKSDAG